MAVKYSYCNDKFVNITQRKTKYLLIRVIAYFE